MIGYGMCSNGTEETSAPAFNERDNYLWSVVEQSRQNDMAVTLLTSEAAT
jgi:hypothetical protein